MKKPLGIALVVTLLFALLLFLAIVAISSSLSLSGKRVTSNQKAALEAQYAAESGLALATTRLSLTGREVADFIENASDFEMPSGTDWASLRSYLQKFCGVTNDPDDPAFVPTDKPAVGRVICTADPDRLDWSDPRAAPYSIFLDGHIDAARYPTGTAPEDYWRARLGPQTFERTLKTRGRLTTAYRVAYGFVPWRAEVLPNATVRLTFRALPTVSSGYLAKEGADVARHKIEQAFTGELRIDLRPPSFSHFMLFTNYQRAGAGAGAERVYFYDGTLFDGPVHTNDKFNFTGRPWFGDSVTSVGCEAENAAKDDCLDARPGYYYWDAGARSHVKVTPPIDPIPPAWAEPAFEGGLAWDRDYIALPKTSSDQYRAAKNGGLFIEDDDATSSTGDVNVEAVTLSTDVVAGVKYQFVQVHGRRNVGTRTVPGRCVADPPPPPPGPPGPPPP
ncbi:DUF4900 domain-containing protein, partial [Oceanithermus desulfurans]